MESSIERELTKSCPSCGSDFPGVNDVCPLDGTKLQLKDSLIGTTLAGRYKILSKIGRGGMSVVYKGQHLLMDRIVAIKMLHADLISDPVTISRFQQEAKAVSSLTHPNVILIFDFGLSSQGLPYLVMDYLQGESLSDILKRQGHLPVKRCVEIFTQACDALTHAHHKGIIHRDIKPANIMLTIDEDQHEIVKVVDFGIAKMLPRDGEEAIKLTQTGEIFGTPLYMSPEQIMGRQLDVRSDIYSLGCVIYESLTGRPPCLGNNAMDTMNKHLAMEPPHFVDALPEEYIPEAIEAVVWKALAKDPEKRYQTMNEFKQDLLIAGGPTDWKDSHGKAPTLRATGWQVPVNRKQLYAGIGAGVLAGILLIGWAMLSPQGPYQQSLASKRWQELTDESEKAVQAYDFSRAIRSTEQAVIEAKKLGIANDKLGDSLHDLGALYRLTEDYKKAEKCLFDSQQIRERLNGAESPEVADCLDNLGAIYRKQGKFKQAEGFFDRSLAIKTKNGDDDESTAVTLNSLGMLHSASGKYAEAESEYSRALKIRESTLGANNPATADVLTNLGLLYQRQDKSIEAEAMYQKAIKAYESQLGPNDISLDEPLRAYADLLRKTNRFPEAEQLEKRLAKIEDANRPQQEK
ncbi:MAG: serine/threonine-protein kinase [Candidatus Obscuribacterales bacterium]|nr:serine/threonine-protein kinase [Candidatus Obscuribacterales bacterium]